MDRLTAAAQHSTAQHSTLSLSHFFFLVQNNQSSTLNPKPQPGNREMAFSHSLRRLSTSTATAAAAVASSASASAASSPISISKAKSKLRKVYDADKALEIYSSVKDYSSPMSARYAQDLTVRRLAKSRRFSDIVSFIESHKSDPKITQEPFLSSLIRSYGVAGMFDQALTTFHQMDQLGTPRSSISFNALLSACVQSKLYDRVPALFFDIPSQYGVLPDKMSYGILLKSYCEMGKSEKALKTLAQMEKEGVEVTAITFTTVLDCLYKKQEVIKAERLWCEMVETDGALDVAAYNVRMKHLLSEGPDRVKELIHEMGNFGLKPDTISYNYLMTCYCQNGMMEEAYKVFEGLESNGCIPNAASFRTLIYYSCRNEMFDKGHALFWQSLKVHKIPDFNTMKYLVEGLVEKEKIKEAKGVIRTIKKKFPPNFLNAWKKLEQSLGLVSANDATSEEDEVYQMATA